MSAGGVATADRKTIIKDTSDNFEVVTTTYAHGKSLRWESEVLVPGDPQRPVANILNADRGASYVLDLNAREYVAPRSAEPILTLAMWLHRPRISSSGKTVRIYSEAVDTGERRQMFGLTARHLIIHQRTTAEAGACSGNSTMERDGWYVPAVSASAYQGTFLMAVGRACRDNIVVAGARIEPGFALAERETRTSLERADHGRGSDIRRREVLEFSDRKIDPSLFEPPADFVRVDTLRGEHALSWSEHLELNWRELERSVESWFE
jgi:hypothetical protein